MNPSLIHHSVNGLSYYQYALFQSIPGVTHGIFTRHGGTSLGDYKSLNLSFSVGDDPQKVAHNRGLAQEALGIACLRSLRQVHGKKAVIIRDHRAQDLQQRSASETGDILMTQVPQQGLMIKQADCQSVLLYDPGHRAIANIHCGWRGNVGNIIGEAVNGMEAAYGSRPAELMAAIGPSLGPCCAQFINYRQEIPEAYWMYQTRPYYFDLWQLSRDQLIAAGVLKINITTAGLCTSCRTDDFFSYRKEKTTGRFATVIALR
jgi:hypothetical protein